VFESSDENTSDEDDTPAPAAIGSNTEPHLRDLRPDSHSFNLVDDDESFPLFKAVATADIPVQQTAPPTAQQVHNVQTLPKFRAKL